jgi:hypothetical protein
LINPLEYLMTLSQRKGECMKITIFLMAIMTASSVAFGAQDCSEVGAVRALKALHQVNCGGCEDGKFVTVGTSSDQDNAYGKKSLNFDIEHIILGSSTTYRVKLVPAFNCLATSVELIHID